MKRQTNREDFRQYRIDDSCIFKTNKGEYGALSNMASGFPLNVKGIQIRTTEALYQASRYPHLPEVQLKIIAEKSPMTAKMIARANSRHSRKDWENVRVKIMKWCLNVKLAQNFVSFGTALHQTGLRYIVENSAKDDFWGAIPNEDETVFTGKNALGRLIMDLRQKFYSSDMFSLLLVEPPDIESFLLEEEEIGIIDERETFINWLRNYWNLETVEKFGYMKEHSDAGEIHKVYSELTRNSSVRDTREKYKTKKPKRKETGTRGRKKILKTDQSELFR